MKTKSRGRLSIYDLKPGQSGILDSLHLTADEAQRLMEIGFLPGSSVEVGRSAPGGDPRVYRVDGSEFAMRRETAVKILLRVEPTETGTV